jgi:hypothetical protein
MPLEKKPLRNGDDLTERTFLLEAIPAFYNVLHAKPQIKAQTRQMDLSRWYDCTAIREYYRIEDDTTAYDVEYEAEGKEDKRILVTKSSVNRLPNTVDEKYAVLSMSTVPTPNETLSSGILDYQIDYNGPTDSSPFTYIANCHEAEVQSLQLLAELRSFVPTRLIVE